MTWAKKCGASNPNFSAVSRAVWARSLPMLPDRNRLVGKPIKQGGDNQETDDLGKEMRRVQPKFLRRVPGGLGQVAADASRSESAGRQTDKAGRRQSGN